MSTVYVDCSQLIDKVADEVLYAGVKSVTSRGRVAVRRSPTHAKAAIKAVEMFDPFADES